jgi:hypothetical protein
MKRSRRELRSDESGEGGIVALIIAFLLIVAAIVAISFAVLRPSASPGPNGIDFTISCGTNPANPTWCTFTPSYQAGFALNTWWCFGDSSPCTYSNFGQSSAAHGYSSGGFYVVSMIACSAVPIPGPCPGPTVSHALPVLRTSSSLMDEPLGIRPFHLEVGTNAV